LGNRFISLDRLPRYWLTYKIYYAGYPNGSRKEAKDKVSTIARVWRGVTAAEKADAYLEYLKRTGVADCRRTAGNRGVKVLRRIAEGRAEFMFVSYWESFDAIRRFAGPEPEKAVYYPEDRAFLVALEPTVVHFDVLVDEGT
jgi:heme-degrading monooxygenase HmoA